MASASVMRSPGKSMNDIDITNFSIELPQGDYHRVIVSGDDGDSDFLKAADMLARAVLMRDMYKQIDKGQLEDFSDLPDDMGLPEMVDGIYVVPGLPTVPVPWQQYIKHVQDLFELLEVGPWLSVCKTRLQVLEEKFELYKLLNGEVEAQYDPTSGGGGIHASCVKVDNNVRLTTAMTAQQLVDYIHQVVATQGDELVKHENGMPISLTQALNAYGVKDASTLTAEGLGLHPLQRKRFNEFDILDARTNSQVAEILRLFLQPKGTINQGKFFAGLVRPILESHEKESLHRRSHARVVTEYKIPINGYTRDEWMRQAAFLKNSLQVGYSRNRWVAHIQRRASDRADTDCVTNEDQLRHIFEPMFIATLDPLNPEYAAVAEVLKNVGAINITSDEAFRSTNLHATPKPPSSIMWSSDCPDDYYFFYYVWANLCVLNALRKKKGLNVIHFRPTCGESTPHWDQLVCSYLLADSIAQGIKLQESSVMQYLYMMGRIGVCMSPLSNNAACFLYQDNPFLPMFKRGLLVTLSTDNPLHYHHSNEPLLEEYSTAQKMFQLSATDLSEIARNSVIISCFSDDQKQEWIGSLGWEGGGSKKSLVCDFRLHFRQDCLLHEQALLNYVLHQAAKSAKDPVPVANIPMISRFAKLGSGTVPPVNDRRRTHLLESKIAFPRISVGNRISTPHDYREAVTTIGRLLALRRRYIWPVLREAAKFRRVLVEDVFRHDHTGFVPDPDTSDDDNTMLQDQSMSLAAASLISAQPSLSPRGYDSGVFDPSIWSYGMYYGVCLISRAGTAPLWPSFVPEYKAFLTDVNYLCDRTQNDMMLDVLAKLRLNLLEHRYRLHLAMNIGRESGTLKEKEHNNRDFYAARKVDNNVHTEACMNARLLFHFFTEKVKNNGDDVVMERNGLPVTLRRVISELGINVNRLTVDELTGRLAWEGGREERDDTSAEEGDDTNMLKEIFLKTDNYIRGRYFAELTKLVFENNKLDEACFSELRVEISGRKTEEWPDLAEWIDRYGLINAQNRWMIRIPRNYSRLKRSKHVNNFGHYLENIFTPLWEVSMRPAEHTKLHYLLYNVSGFDFVGDETEVDIESPAEIPPLKWTRSENPSFTYYVYYLWANIVTLNEFRKSRGLSTFTFRPHCGEAGGISHLAVGFLLANSINHGITLAKFPAMEYVFYLAQVGITMSPLSNTHGAIAYLDNPFPKFYMRGLNVALSTNTPLMFHFTSEPLIEELAIASKIWVLSNNDLSELSRNSVLQSGFTRAWKKEALGPLYNLKSTLGNDVSKSHVSNIRVAFRYEAYHTEMDFLDSILVTCAMTNSEESAERFLLGPDVSTGRLPRVMATLDVEGDRADQHIGPTGTREAMERLTNQIENLDRAIQEERKKLRDQAAQNSTMASEIIRLCKKADDAEQEAMVIQAALVPDYWFDASMSDIEMVEKMLACGASLRTISLQIGYSGRNALRDIGTFLEGQARELEQRRKLLSHACADEVLSRVLKAQGNEAPVRRKPTLLRHRDGAVVAALLEAGVTIAEIGLALWGTSQGGAWSVLLTNHLYHITSDDDDGRAKRHQLRQLAANKLFPGVLDDRRGSFIFEDEKLAGGRMVDDTETPLTDVEMVESLLASGMAQHEVAERLSMTGADWTRDMQAYLGGQNVKDRAMKRKKLVVLYKENFSPSTSNIHRMSDTLLGGSGADDRKEEDVAITSTLPVEMLVMELLISGCTLQLMMQTVGIGSPADFAAFVAAKLPTTPAAAAERRQALVLKHHEYCVVGVDAPKRSASLQPALPPSQITSIEMVESLLSAGLTPSEISRALGYSSGQGKRDVATFLAERARDMASRRFKLDELYENRVRRR